MLFLVPGFFSLIFGPILVKVSDSIGKFRMFLIGSIITIVMVYIYTNLGVTPVWLVIGVNVLLFVGVTSRMISSQALISGVPTPQDRGAFMSVNSSIQYLSGGIASFASGLLTYQDKTTKVFQHYNYLGYAVIGSMVVCALMMYFINRMVNRGGLEIPKHPKKEEIAAQTIPEYKK